MSSKAGKDGVETGTARIRRAEPRDAPALLGLIGELAAYHGDTAATDLETLTRDVFGAPAWATAFVAEARGVLTGYMLLCPVYQAQVGRRGLTLHHLFVAPAARRGGLGRRLVEAARDHAASLGCAFINVGTNADNAVAQAFYEGLGFEQAPPSGPRFSLRLGQPAAPR